MGTPTFLYLVKIKYQCISQRGSDRASMKKCAHYSALPLSLPAVSFNCNRQIHIRVNSTIDVKCSCRRERPNVMSIAAAEVHADSGSSWLLERFLISAGIPHTIFDDMHS